LVVADIVPADANTAICLSTGNLKKARPGGDAMNKRPLRPITKDDVARFREDGAICVRNVLDSELCERMNAAVERLYHPSGRREHVTGFRNAADAKEWLADKGCQAWLKARGYGKLKSSKRPRDLNQ
jgi:hypothetical protein